MSKSGVEARFILWKCLHVVALVPEVGCKSPGRAALLIEVGSKDVLQP